MEKKIIFILLIQLFIGKITQAQLPPASPEYHLVFHDEFDSLFTTIIDTSKWDRTPEWNQSSNLTGNFYCCTVPQPCNDSSGSVYLDKAYIIRDQHDSSTVKISNGTCKLVTDSTDYYGEVWNWPLCSNALCTGLNCDSSLSPPRCFRVDTLLFKSRTGMLYSKKRFKYGYFEMSYKLPATPTLPNTNRGFGPNFWLFNTNPTIGNYWSEIDIFEINAYRDYYPYPLIHENYFTTTVTYKNQTLRRHDSRYFFGNTSGNTWTKVGMWWTPSFIRVYINDTLIHDFPLSSDSIPPDSLIGMPIFIDINSPATNYCNRDSVNTQYPYTYEIDYLRVYQLKQECDTDKVYCNINQSTFVSGLYKSLTVGGTSCTATFSSSANITGLGNDFVLLNNGFSFDNSSQGYFDVKNCFSNQFYGRFSQPTIQQPPPDAWHEKFKYTK